MIAIANWNSDLGDYWEWSAEGLYGSDPPNDAYRLFGARQKWTTSALEK